MLCGGVSMLRFGYGGRENCYFELSVNLSVDVVGVYYFWNVVVLCDCVEFVGELFIFG